MTSRCTSAREVPVHYPRPLTVRRLKIGAPDFAAILVILLAGALSTAWVFLVPIFQAPDEPAHFDYAMSIFSAGRLIRANEGPVKFVVSPYTQYLLRATDFERIAWHSSMRAPVGYGSRAFFARLDAGAPSGLGTASRGVSYIVAFYPFGFYALEALWLKVVSVFTTSLTALFFSARLLCVLLTMLGFWFSYRIARRLGLPPWLAVAFLVAFAFFPLTTFVSSYVQPDNLAFALVTLVLLLALKVRENATSWPILASMGAAMGLLAVTKYQFFSSVAVPACALLFVTRRSRHGWLNAGAATIAVLAPSAALLAIQVWINAGAHRLSGMTSAALTPGSTGGVTLSVLGIAQQAAFRSVAAVADCYVSGLCAATYWQVIGWFDNPIVIASWKTESLIRLVVSLISTVTLAVLVVSVLRIIPRVILVGRTRGSLVGWALAVGDPVFLSYALFICTMLALYVLTNNAFGAEGRHFYPFVFAGFLSVIWYAPRTLGRQARKMQIAMAALAIVYSIAASIFALKDVVYRYYGPADGTFVAARWSSSLVSAGMPTGILRPVKSTAYQVDNLDMPDTFRKTSKPLSVSGTAAFPEKGLPAQSIAVVLDGRRSLPVLPHQYDVTIAEGSRNKRYAYSSFFSYVPTGSLDEGVHVVRAFARAPGSPTYQMLSPTRLFFLTQGNGEFSSGFVSKLNGISRLNVRATFEGVCRGTSYTGSGGRAASIGSVMLVKARVPSARDGTDAAWLLAGRRPYPMKALGDESRSVGDTTPAGERVYTGTVPTQGLSAGTLAVRFFLFDPAMGRYLEAGPPLRLTLFDRVANGDPTVSRPIPSACVDPLRALQGSIP